MPLYFSHFSKLLTRRRILALVVTTVLVGCTAFAVTSVLQEKSVAQHTKPTKLTYCNPELTAGGYTPPAIPPIAMSSDRLLVPVGDMLYMLDSTNSVLWRRCFEPDIIRDVMVDPKGDIYLTAFEASILVLDSSGKEIWRTGMSTGSASYTEIKNYDGGFLVIADMEGYRQRGSNREDILQFWKDKKLVWDKPFPRDAKLQVAGNRILAISTTKDGREITEIR